MKNSSSIFGVQQLNEQKEKNHYKKRAEKLFNKLQGLQLQIQENKTIGYRKMLTQMQILEQDITKKAQHKMNRYEKILNRVTAINLKIEDQKIQNEKYLLRLNNMVERFDRQYSKMFQKIQKDRIKDQENLNQFINNKINLLLQKFKKKQINLNIQEYVERLKNIRKEMKQYFEQLQKQESQTKNQFNKTLQHYHSLIKQQLQKNIEQGVKKYLKQLHQDITNKVKIMKLKREQVQQNIISMLQNIISNTIIKVKENQ